MLSTYSYGCSNVAKLFEKNYIFKKKICVFYKNFIFLSENLFFSSKVMHSK